MERCQICEQSGESLCQQCSTQIGETIDLIKKVWADTKNPRFPSPAGGETRSKARPLPGGDEWLDWRAAYEMKRTLAGWAAMFAETTNTVGPDKKVTKLLDWLRTHYPAAANKRTDTAAFLQDLTTIAKRGNRVAGNTTDHGARFPCPTDECAGILRVNAREMTATTRCKQCGIERATAQILFIAANSDAWVPEETAAEVAQISRATLRRWAAGGNVDRNKGHYWLPSVREHATTRRKA
jgi:hypothetical protein